MFGVTVLGLLGLVAVSHSAPLACEDLARPSDQLDLHHLGGRWELVAGSLSDLEHRKNFTRTDSASIHFANASETSKMSYTLSLGFGDDCKYWQSNIRSEGSGFTFDRVNLTVTPLHTSCPDCMVMRFDDYSRNRHTLYLVSRRRGLEQSEMEEFRAQAECLNMPPPVMMDPTKKLCPEYISTDAVAQTEEKTEGHKA